MLSKINNEFPQLNSIYRLPVYISSILMIAGLLSSCTPHLTSTPVVEPVQVPADFPDNEYQRASANGSKILRIDKKNSIVTIIVHRGGILARLGHDHVVASHDIFGWVDMDAGRADLYIPLAKLSVDEASLRAEAKFTTQPSAGAIEGTRNNMQEKVLESARYPFALIHIKRMAKDSSLLTVAITLHGTIKSFEVPVKVERTAESFTFNGQLSFKQTDFGITPFSILGGALQVEDQLDFQFNLIAGAIH
jgi:hypothetical protein